MAEQFSPCFCISILKVLRIEILRHSLDFNAFCVIQESCFRLLKFPQIKEGGPNFLVGTNSAERLNYFPLPLLYFNFKSFKDPNFLPFISFECILHDWGVPFSEVWNFDKLKTGAPESCTIHWNLMNQEEFWSLKLLKWKYRMGNQIIALFFKIGSSQEIRSSPPL